MRRGVGKRGKRVATGKQIKRERERAHRRKRRPRDTEKVEMEERGREGREKGERERNKGTLSAVRISRCLSFLCEETRPLVCSHLYRYCSANEEGDVLEKRGGGRNKMWKSLSWVYVGVCVVCLLFFLRAGESEKGVDGMIACMNTFRTHVYARVPKGNTACPKHRRGGEGREMDKAVSWVANKGDTAEEEEEEKKRERKIAQEDTNKLKSISGIRRRAEGLRQPSYSHLAFSRGEREKGRERGKKERRKREEQRQ